MENCDDLTTRVSWCLELLSPAPDPPKGLKQVDKTGDLELRSGASTVISVQGQIGNIQVWGPEATTER